MSEVSLAPPCCRRRRRYVSRRADPTEARPGGVTVPDMRLTAWDKLRRCSAIQCTVAGDETRRRPLSRQRERRDCRGQLNLVPHFVPAGLDQKEYSLILFLCGRANCRIDFFVTTCIGHCPYTHGTRTENYSLSRWHVAISESSCSDLKFSEGDICFFFCKLIGMGYIKNNVFPILVLKIS